LISNMPRGYGSGSIGGGRLTGANGSVRILELDPELGLRIPAAEISEARATLVTGVLALEPGHWEVPRGEGARGRLGFLILDGLLARDMTLVGRTSTELLGEGDVVQPWVASREEGLVRYRAAWHVLSPVRLAVLDEELTRTLARWPQVISTLLERAVRRTHRMSIHEAILALSPVETRLLVLFWHLAERWGHVTPAGVALRLRLPHSLLGQLVGCRRASVTTALQHIYASGELARRPDGTWLLPGNPPDELTSVHWETGAPAPRTAARHG
jgi:CRP/FNR family transcriptional regulator, cyclic AMP receptor protein